MRRYPFSAFVIVPASVLVLPLLLFNRYAHTAGPGHDFRPPWTPKIFKFENRVFEDETLKFFFSGVDFPPPGLYLKEFCIWPKLFSTFALLSCLAAGEGCLSGVG